MDDVHTAAAQSPEFDMGVDGWDDRAIMAIYSASVKSHTTKKEGGKGGRRRDKKTATAAITDLAALDPEDREFLDEFNKVTSGVGSSGNENENGDSSETKDAKSAAGIPGSWEPVKTASIEPQAEEMASASGEGGEKGEEGEVRYTQTVNTTYVHTHLPGGAGAGEEPLTETEVVDSHPKATEGMYFHNCTVIVNHHHHHYHYYPLQEQDKNKNGNEKALNSTESTESTE